MNKLAQQIAVALLAAAPGVSLALGLGEIDVKSNLNEPLRAEIELIYSSASEAQGADVNLANAEDFARVGLDAGMITAPLRFAIGRNSEGRYVINVSTADPVLDPFVDFLIEVNWDNGRLLREYVVLLDPPLVAPTAAAPTYSDPATTTTTTAQPQTTAPSQPFATPASGSRSGDGTYGPVQAGETLWEIASEARPDDSVSMQQMMVMLQQMNPDAFQNNNINLLKRGSVLRLPTRNDFDLLSDEAARAQVRSQNESWREYVASRRDSLPVVSDAGVTADVSSASPAPAGSAESRLRLRPPTAGGDSGGRATGALQSALDDSQSELASAREDLLAAEAENADLQSRVGELESLVERLRALNIEDSELADLQSTLGDQAGDAQDAAAASGELIGDAASDLVDSAGDAADGAIAAIDDTADAMMDVAGDAAAGAEQVVDDAAAALGDAADAAGDAAADATAAVADQADQAVNTIRSIKPPKSSGGVMDLLKKFWYAPVALLALLLGGVFLARRRSEPEFAPTGGAMFDPILDERTTAEQAAPSEPTAEIDTDPGYDEAGLIAAIDSEPTDPQTHLALLRSYYAAGEQDKFAVAAMRMQGEVDSDNPAWTEVRSMGAALLPDNPMFVAEPAADDDGDFGLDFDTLEQPEQDAGEPEFGLALEGDELDSAADQIKQQIEDTAEMGGLDLDLEAASDAAEEQLAGVTDNTLGLDADLSLDDLADSLTDTADDGLVDAAAAVTGIADVAESASDDSLDLDLELDDASASASQEIDDALADLGDLELGDTDMFGGDDAITTKLDLAETYMRMGDPDGARGMLEEVVSEGSDEQKARATQLLEELNF